jgi:very-short-patch-repair endonuclease
MGSACRVKQNAVKVSTRVFGRLEVWPDIILAKLKVAIEYDDPGRGGNAHRRDHEASDLQKDAALREVGWEVIRVRVGGLRRLGPGISRYPACQMR